MSSIFYDARNVYSWLEDEISRNVFNMRLAYSATGDIRYVVNMDSANRNLSSDIEKFAKQMESPRRKIIYGAGVNGKAILELLAPNNTVLFIDNYREESIDDETGLPIYSFKEFTELFPNELNNYQYIISVINRRVSSSIKNDLIAHGVSGNNIVVAPKEWRNNESQYFDFFEPRENEVFVDCGCYDGSTCYRFAGWCGDKGYEYIYGFEPDSKSFYRCEEMLASLAKCKVFNLGTSLKDETVYFKITGKEDACALTKEETEGLECNCIEKVNVVSLDSFLKGRRVTFIKMDIEGMEWETLLGAERILREQKPRLAISVYHKIDDFVRIPVWLKKVNPDYKFYFRHYSLVSNETILYVE